METPDYCTKRLLVIIFYQTKKINAKEPRVYPRFTEQADDDLSSQYQWETLILRKEEKYDTSYVQYTEPKKKKQLLMLL